jgi:hypothetical protein
MNDLGLALVWLALQVTLLLVPALALNALALRRGPDSGAWVAALSLGLVVVLNAAALTWRLGNRAHAALPRALTSSTPGRQEAGADQTVGRPGWPDIPGRSRSHTRGRWGVASLEVAWDRLERQAIAPLARCRPWAGTVGAVLAAATVAGLFRLILGLWAVGLCRRQGRVIGDGPMPVLLDELRRSMGYRRPVELLEIRGLTTPAAAGWQRPVILLPGDWRSWDGIERRAVLAHELAHLVRSDYAAGLLARLAVALNCYHPMVRWMAARLQLQQELAADALGARFARGRSSYLVALSRLALRHDGRSPSWPARAFLPARGTLIRRIAMLRDERCHRHEERYWSRAHRFLAATALVGLMIGVATFRGPALRAADAPSTPLPVPAAAPAVDAPLELRYVPAGMDGVVAIRPAALLRHAGMERLAKLVADELFPVFFVKADARPFDSTAPGKLKLGFEDIESVVTGVNLSSRENGEKPPMHRLMLGGVLTIRTRARFDWLTYLRQWGADFEEVRQDGRRFHKTKGSLEHLGPDGCLYLHDERTVVVGALDTVRAMAAREALETPDYLRGPDWERASRGLVAIAIDNHDGKFPERYDLGRPDDALFLSLFASVDRWTLGVDDTEAIALYAAAVCRTREASAAIARTIESLRKLGQEAVLRLDRAPDNHDGPETELIQMAQALLARLRVEPTEHSVELRAEAIGTLADLARVLELLEGESEKEDQGGDGASKAGQP